MLPSMLVAKEYYLHDGSKVIPIYSYQFAECVSADSPITASKLETFLKWPPQAPRTLEQLKNLETLHEGLDLYLWLR